MKDLRQLLHALKIPVVRTTEFFQGRTQRWGIAWSFTAPRDKALGPLRQGAYHSTGSGFFAQVGGG